MFVQVYMPNTDALIKFESRVVCLEEHTRHQNSVFQAIDRHKWLTSPYPKWFETQHWTWAERKRSYRRR